MSFRRRTGLRVARTRVSTAALLAAKLQLCFDRFVSLPDNTSLAHRKPRLERVLVDPIQAQLLRCRVTGRHNHRCGRKGVRCASAFAIGVQFDPNYTLTTFALETRMNAFGRIAAKEPAADSGCESSKLFPG